MRRLLTVILIFVPATIFSQISGVVMDKSSGYPARHATIRVVGWNKVFTADIHGRFTLSDEVLNKTLVISAIGFIPERITAAREFMTIELKTLVYLTDEVFITAEKNKAELVADSCDKGSPADWHYRKAGVCLVAGLQMDSLRPGPRSRIVPGRKVRSIIIY